LIGNDIGNLGQMGNAKTVSDRYNYSLRYHKFLTNMNSLPELLTFTPNKRLHVMKAMSSLSKFCGCDDRWKHAIKRHKITWSSGNNSFKIFDQIVNQTNYVDMLEWIRKVIALLPKSHSNILLFNFNWIKTKWGYQMYWHITKSIEQLLE